MTVRTSTEILFHFTCDKCNLWWSFATDSISWQPNKLYCPHCGTLHNYQEKELGGPEGPEPTRYGTWENKGREVDF